MIRTQVYLTESEKNHLDAISRTSGISQSQMIRQSIDDLIEKYAPAKRLAAVHNAFGIWKGRDNIHDLRDLRAGWGRRMERITKK